MDKDKLRKAIDEYRYGDKYGIEALERLYNGASVQEVIPSLCLQDLHYLASHFPEVVRYYHWRLLPINMWVNLFTKYPEIESYVNWTSMSALDIVEFARLMPQYYKNCIVSRLGFFEVVALGDVRAKYNNEAKNG